MGPENPNPLDELKSLDHQVDLIQDLAGLKPIFFRLEDIAKENANDFEVQLAVGDIKQHLVNRGTKLKDVRVAAPEAPPPPVPEPVAARVASPPPLPAQNARPVELPSPAPAAPPMPPPLPTGLPTDLRPSKKLMSSGRFSAGAEQSVIQPEATKSSGPPTLPPPPRPPTETPPAATPPLAAPFVASGIMPAALATTENKSPAEKTTTPPAYVTAPQPTGPQRIPLPPKPPSQPPKPPPNWKRALWIGAIAGAIIAIIGIAALVNMARNRNRKETAGNAEVQVEIATTPPGASVRINGEQKCTSNCKLSLAPGNYQVTAFLDGYEPAASGVMVSSGQPASVSLALEAQAPTLRILTDLDQGKIVVDNQPPADLQEGQFIVDRVQPGTHTVKIIGKTGEGSFSFDSAPARQPVVTGSVTARNLSAVLVSSLGNQAHVITNAGPLKLAVNGQPETDAGPAGVDLKNFQAGVDELIVGEGKDQRNVKETFGPAPMLTAFFKSDLNIGTLIVSTGEDNVRVFLNNKEYPRRTQRGQLRIQTIGKLAVRVMKDGFDSPPVQNAEVKKGDETRLEFKLKPLPQLSTLQISGAMPGAEVLIDQRNAGTIGADGSYNNPSLTPGDHIIEVRHDQFVPKRFQRTFRAGQTVAVSGADVALAAERVQPPPTEKKAEAPPPPPREKAAPPPPPKAGTMADWEDNTLWRQENGVWLHQGAGFLFYKLPPKGIFTFTVQLLKGGSIFRGGKIRWVVNYADPKNYALYELDNKNFTAKVVMKGKTYERGKIPLKDLEKQKSFTIQVDVTPEHIVHKMFTGGEWINLDSWAETNRNFSDGKFGFQVQGDDQIGITDFKFQPK